MVSGLDIRMGHLYDQEPFVNSIVPDPNSLVNERSFLERAGRTVRLYRERGAHPFYIQQALRLACLCAPESVKENAMASLSKDLGRSFRRRQAVPGSSNQLTLSRLRSRLYGSESPLEELDIGIVYGAIIECQVDILSPVESAHPEVVDANWLAYWRGMLELVGDHPLADFGMIRSIQQIHNFVLTLFPDGGAASSRHAQELRDHGRNYFVKLVLRKGIHKVTLEGLRIWDDQALDLHWQLWITFFNALVSRNEPWAAEVLSTILAAREGKTSIERRTAGRILGMYPKLEDIDQFNMQESNFVLNAIRGLLSTLVEEMPENGEIQNLMYRWFNSLSYNGRAAVSVVLAFDWNGENFVGLNEGAKPIIDGYFGSGAWGIFQTGFTFLEEETPESDGDTKSRESEFEHRFWGMIRHGSEESRGKEQNRPEINLSRRIIRPPEDPTVELQRLIGEIELFIGKLPEGRQEEFLNELKRVQAQKRLPFARGLLRRVLIIVEHREDDAPLEEMPQDQPVFSPTDASIPDTPRPKVPAYLIPTEIRAGDLSNRLVRIGWERVRSRGKASHRVYRKGERRMTFSIKSNKVSRGILASALSQGQFTQEEAEELFS